MTIEENNLTEFNMANSTLQRLDNILKAINDISIRTELLRENTNFLKKGRGQHMKLKLTRDLFVQSVPLLRPEDISSLKVKIQSLNPEYRNVPFIQNGDKGITRIAHYSQELEQSLDDFIIELQIKLQKKGYFMPKKDKGEM